MTSQIVIGLWLTLSPPQGGIHFCLIVSQGIMLRIDSTVCDEESEEAMAEDDEKVETHNVSQNLQLPGTPVSKPRT